MNIRDYSGIREFLRVFDLLALFISFYAAVQVRLSEQFIGFASRLTSYEVGREIEGAVWMALWVVIPVWMLLFSYFGAYRLERTITIFQLVKNMVIIHTTGGFILLSYLFATGSWGHRRSFVLMFVLFIFLCSLLMRLLILLMERVERSTGRNKNRLLIIGDGKKVDSIMQELYAHSYWGFAIVGIVSTEPEPEKTMFGLPCLGNIGELREILRNTPVDDVVIASDKMEYVKIKRVLKACELIGVNVHMVPDEYDLEIASARMGTLGSIRYISFESVKIDPFQAGIKRSIDILFSVAMLPFLIIAYIACGIAIKLDSKGSIIYSSTRVTRGRRRFTFYKFRTMVSGAEERFGGLEEHDMTDGPISKIENDPRVTKIGRFLRMTSLDELPQIINVLMGDMSMVGPRPPTEEEVDVYTEPQLRKLSMPQGITGLWQVTGRDGVVRFEDRLALDLTYIDNWSLWMDLKILVKTPLVVLKGAM